LPVTVGSHYQIVSLDLSILHAMRRIVREEVPEMPDRIIAATALALNLPLITRDSQITKTSLIHCIW